MRRAWLVLLTLASGCTGQTRSQAVGGPPPKQVPFEELTLQNILRWPSTTEYLEATGHGRPPEDATDAALRRRSARDEAAVEAQKKLIAQLQELVPKDRIHSLLRGAEVSKLEFAYDDACTVTLRIPKEAVVGKPPIE